MLRWLNTELFELSTAEYQILLAGMAVLSVYLLYRSYQAYRRFRFIGGIATSKIRSAPQGYVELKGLGEWMPGDQIHSPLSGNRCLWFHCLIDKKERRGKRTTWVNISDQLSEHLFHLVDETGKCVIDPDHAHVIPEIERSWTGSSLAEQNSPPKTRLGLRSIKIGIGIGRYRFRERLITPASNLYALGNFQTHRNEPNKASIKSQVDDLVREWRLKPGKYLTSFDRNANEKIQDSERQEIYREARRQVISQSTKKNKPQNLMTKPPKSQQPFILSAIEEDQLVSRKKLVSLISVLSAFLLFCAILALITIRPVVAS